jgi:carbamoyl-phosphate synthase large subunit
MRVTVGVLGAGSLIGQGIIKALKMSSLDYRLVGLDYFQHAVGLYWSDAAHILPDVLSPKVSEAEYLESLIQILKQESVEVLLVATDFDVPRLAECRQILETETGCKVVVSSPEVAEIGDDKWATFRFLESHGLPGPKSLVDLDNLDAFVAKVGFPLIVKPRRGARSQGVSLVTEQAGLSPALKFAGSDPIIQQAVGTIHEEYTAGAVVFDGDCLGAIVMRRDLRNGNTHRAYLEPSEEIENLIREAALALDSYGPVNFQLRVGPAGPAIFEINARFSGTTIMRAMAGFNEVESVIRWVALDQRIPLVQQKYGVVLRYWEELFLTNEEYQSTAAGNPG